MWKETLPEQCPPASAIEIEDCVYRITQFESLSESDILPYTKLYPDNSRYKHLCVYFGVSFFDSLERAKEKALLLVQKNFTNTVYVQKVQMEKSYGVSEFNEKSGHHNIFFYAGFSADNFEVLEVQQC